jgi:hypothetical protein
MAQQRRETSGAALTNWLAVASSIIHRAMASYETGMHEFRAPGQSAAAAGASFLPRELSPARTSVHRTAEKAPLPRASTTACCSRAPRPILPGTQEKKRIARLPGFPGREASKVLMMMMRSTLAANMAASTSAAFSDSMAERSFSLASLQGR